MWPTGCQRHHLLQRGHPVAFAGALPGQAQGAGVHHATSPVAWRHLLLGGHYTFEDGGKTIDLDALLDGLDLE